MQGCVRLEQLSPTSPPRVAKLSPQLASAPKSLSDRAGIWETAAETCCREGVWELPWPSLDPGLQDGTTSS